MTDELTTGQPMAAPVPTAGDIYVETLKQGRDVAEQRAAGLQALVAAKDAEIERLTAELEDARAATAKPKKD